MSQPELHSEIEKVDAELAKNNALLWRRQFKAYHRLVKRFGTPGQSFQPFGTELLEEIHAWYLRRYGQRMNPEIKLGEKPIMIRGVLYFMRFPVTYGTFRIDIFQHIQGITPDLLASLSTGEQDEIVGIFEIGVNQFAAIAEIGVRLANTAQEIRDIFLRGLEDITASIAILKICGDAQGSIIASHPAAEKFMKAALAIRTGDTLNNIRNLFGRHGHDLSRGLKALENIDTSFAAIRVHVATIHLPDMNIRYAVQSPSISDAVRKIDAVLAICAFIANQR